MENCLLLKNYAQSHKVASALFFNGKQFKSIKLLKSWWIGCQNTYCYWILFNSECIACCQKAHSKFSHGWRTCFWSIFKSKKNQTCRNNAWNYLQFFVHNLWIYGSKQLKAFINIFNSFGFMNVSKLELCWLMLKATKLDISLSNLHNW